MTHGEISRLIRPLSMRVLGDRNYASPRRRVWSPNFIANTRHTSRRLFYFTARAIFII